MYARTQTPFLALFLAAICLLGAAGSILTIQNNPLTAVALFLVVGALLIVILRPGLALGLLVLSRFTFEMAWEQRLGGFSMLDLLGAGVPLAVVVVVLLRQPRFAHLPLVKASLVWCAVLWAFAGVYVLAGGDPLMTLENTMRFSSGIPIFLLTVIVVRDFRHALLIFGFWAIAAVPVAVVFYAYGEQDAMSYHGVLRLRALYHDVVTPAVVACMALHICIFFFALGRQRAWSHVRLAGLAIAVILLARMLFLTFHNGLTAVAFLMGFVIAVIRRQHGMILAALALLLVMTQIPDVQRRWWREIAIVQGEHDPIGFASGRPNRWRRYLARWDEQPLMEKVIGVHGTWGNPENQLLQLLVDQGLFVGTFTLGFLLWVLRCVIRWRQQCADPERRLFYATVVGFLVGSVAAWVTATPLAFTNFQWILWCVTGLAAAVHHKDPEPREPPAHGAPAPAQA